MRFSSKLLLGLALTLIAATARPQSSAVPMPADVPDLSGVYDDAGTIVKIAEGEEPPAVISLHALLSLEFNAGLARLLQDRTREVRVKHEGDTFAVDFVDADGETIWAPVWNRSTGGVLRDRRLHLHLKPGKFGNDEYLLVFENVTAHRLLQVQVQRVKATFFGPVYQPYGTFLFHRLE